MERSIIEKRDIYFKEKIYKHESRLDNQTYFDDESRSVISIKKAILGIARNSKQDIDSIEREIFSLFQQNQDYWYLIYNNIIALGEPYESIAKNYKIDQLRKEIESISVDNQHLTFQQKLCKYFGPFFDGHEFKLFSKYLIHYEEFRSAILFEIDYLNEINKQKNIKNSAEITNAEIEHNNNEENFTVLRNKIESNYNTASRLNNIFGLESILITRSSILLVFIYIILVFNAFFDFKIIHMIIAYSIGYIIHIYLKSVAENLEKEARGEKDELEKLKNEKLRSYSNLQNLRSYAENSRFKYEFDITYLEKYLKENYA